MGENNENLLRPFDREVPWQIFGHGLENGCWGRHKNSEIYKLYDKHEKDGNGLG
jgi:hypothetical protein